MRGKACFTAVALSVILISSAASAGDKLRRGLVTDNQIFTSESLGYDLQYRVYLPVDYEKSLGLPVLYVVDGQWYIETGGLTRLLD